MKDRLSKQRIALWRSLMPVVAILALAVAFGLPGCSEKPLDVNTSQEEISFFDLPFDDGVFAKKGLVATYRTEDFITVAEGGTIEISAHGAVFSFVIAPNSFPEDTRFTLAIYILEDTPDKTTVVYEFGPDGLVFTEPALLVLDANVVVPEGSQTIDFYYLNKNRWVYQGTYDRNKDDQFVIGIDHFSRYGTE